jgi:hypothetical protein
MNDLNKSPADLQIEVERLREENAALKEQLSKMYAAHPENACYDVPTWGKLLAAQHRIKQLREALGAWFDNHSNEAHDRLYELFESPDSTAELDAVMKNDARYRWLMDNVKSKRWQHCLDGYYESPLSIVEFIDAAMGEKK